MTSYRLVSTNTSFIGLRTYFFSQAAYYFQFASLSDTFHMETYILGRVLKSVTLACKLADENKNHDFLNS
jgi:hypothetical protein